MSWAARISTFYFFFHSTMVSSVSFERRTEANRARGRLKMFEKRKQCRFSHGAVEITRTWENTIKKWSERRNLKLLFSVQVAKSVERMKRCEWIMCNYSITLSERSRDERVEENERRESHSSRHFRSNLNWPEIQCKIKIHFTQDLVLSFSFSLSLFFSHCSLLHARLTSMSWGTPLLQLSMWVYSAKVRL